jgi:fluoride exporter
MERLNLILLIAFGGSIGAVARYLLSTFIQTRFFTSFPIGTLIINILGCLFIGMFLKSGTALSETQQMWKTFIVVGFIGVFTTFSTFAGDIYELFQGGKPLIGILYLLCNNILGVVMVYFAVTYLDFFPYKK